MLETESCRVEKTNVFFNKKKEDVEPTAYECCKCNHIVGASTVKKIEVGVYYSGFTNMSYSGPEVKVYCRDCAPAYDEIDYNGAYGKPRYFRTRVRVNEDGSIKEDE